MATIIKRGKKYSVVYNYVNDKGETKQKWESFESEKAAKKRKAEVEYPFKQAVRWELIARNPFDNAIVPKVRGKKREIWDAAIAADEAWVYVDRGLVNARANGLR